MSLRTVTGETVRTDKLDMPPRAAGVWYVRHGLAAIVEVLDPDGRCWHGVKVSDGEDGTTWRFNGRAAKDHDVPQFVRDFAERRFLHVFTLAYRDRDAFCSHEVWHVLRVDRDGVTA